MKQKKTNENYKEIEYLVGRAGTTTLYLENENYKHEHIDGEISHHNLSIELSHIYESQHREDNQNGIGKGWRSNLHQYLVKKPYDFQRKRREILYTDGKGIEHTIYEKWYYEDENNQKVYISGEDVFTDGDGKLKTKKSDKFYEVKMECDSDENLTLVLGASLSNHPSQMNYEESYQLSIEFSDGYRKNLLWLGIGKGKVSVPIYYFINSNREKIYLAYYDLVYGDGSVIKNSAGDVMTLEGNEQKELKFDENGCYFDYPTYNGNVKIYPIPSMKYSISHNKKMEDVYLNDDIKQIDSQIEQLESNFKSYALQLNDRKINMSMIDYQNSVKENIGIDNYEKKVKSARDTITNKISDGDAKERQQTYDSAIDDLEKAQKQVNTSIENKQKEIQFEALDHNIYDFVKAKVRLEEIKAKRQTLINEQRKQVNDLIMDEEGNTLGFDGYGRLILIQDKEENKIQIEYGYKKENEGKILSIYSETETIRLDYDKSTGLLNSIVDPQGRKTKYQYDSNENLVSITYNDQKETKFDYENGFSVSSPMLEKTKITEAVNGLNVVGYCYSAVEINQDTKITENGELKVVFEHRYTFDETNVFFKDELLENTAQYIFDNQKTTMIEMKGNKVHAALYKEKYPIYEVEYNIKENYTILDENQIWPEPFTYKLQMVTPLSSRNLAVKVELSNDFVKELKEYAFELVLRYEGKTLKHKFYNMQTFILPFYIDSLTLSHVEVELNPIQLDTFDTTKSMGNCYLIHPKNEIIYEYDTKDRIILKKNQKERIEYLDYDEDDLCHQIKTIDKYNEEVNAYYSYNANKQLILVEDSKGNVNEYTYDEKGNCIGKRSFNKKDASLVRIENLNNETDEKNKVFTQYDKNTGELLSISSSCKGMNNATSFTYNYGLLTSMMHHGMKVGYTYDGQGRKTSVSLNGSTYVTTTYADNCDRKIVELETVLEHATEVVSTYKNGYKAEEVYDKDGQLRKQNLNNEISILYDYDEKNRLVQTTYSDETPNKSITYEDDKIKKVTKGNYSHSFTYDEKDRVSFEQEKENQHLLNDKTYFYENDELTKVLINEILINYQYDVFNRVTHQELDYKKIKLCHDYSYLQKDGSTIDFIAQDVVKIQVSDENDNIIPLTETYNYEYDDKGNIISIDTDDKLTRYQYDELNRLVREDNPHLKKTIFYKYDTGGNILLRKTYNYNINDMVNLTNPKNVDEYAYSCNGWKDQLTSYNGKKCSYDAMGRPTTYKDTKMTWNKNGTLASIGDNITYTYNANGIRTKKVVGGVETNFLLDGTRIVKSTTNNVEIIYRYALNKLVGFCYNDIEFIYERNIFGDIIRIYNSENGEIVGEYVYDGYGNHTIVKDIDGIATLNPFRYRGYFFDTESNLFYLNSRYYDSEVGRFISPDIVSILDDTKGQINGLNLYMYCADNPIIYYDPSGQSFILIGFIIGTIIGAILVGEYAYNTAKENGANGWELFGWTMLGIIGGGLIGGAIGATLGYFAGMSFSTSIPTGFAFLKTTAGTTSLITTGTMTLTVTGAQILSVIGILSAITIMFSKHEKVMKKKAPFSWTNNEEGIEALRNNKGDAVKAALEILRKHGFDNIYNKFNPIKKWLDRIIRKMIGL